MSTLDVGKKLVELCKQGQNAKVMETLYDKNIVSVEAADNPPEQKPNTPRQVTGIDAVREKSSWWNEHHKVHGAVVEGPFPHGDRFAVLFKFDITNNDSNKRLTFEETALYTVKNDKIVKEEFFYPT